MPFARVKDGAERLSPGTQVGRSDAMTACFVQLPKLTVRLPIAPVGPWAPGWTPSAGRGGWEGPSTLSSLAQGKPVGKAVRARGLGATGSPQLRDLICARICAQDAAGRGETRETPHAVTNEPRLSAEVSAAIGEPDETPETHVVWLITQRSRVQILSPLPRPEALSRTEKGPLTRVL